MLMREFKGRFGSSKTGYVWLFLEPLMHVVAITLIFAVRGRQIAGDIDLPVFVLTGIVPFLTFRGIMTQVAGAVMANGKLLNYRQVRPFDAMLARFILEVVLFFIIFFVLSLLAMWLGYRIEFNDPMGFLLAVTCLFFMAFGLSCISSVLAHYFEDWLRVQQIILRGLYFLSGIFFTLDRMPVWLHEYVLWNPILHATEIIRIGFYSGHHVSFGDPNYLITCTVIALASGLLVSYTYRRVYYVNR